MPILPVRVGCSAGRLISDQNEKLPHYSRVCGSCSTVPVPLHNVAGAPVSTASPSEFVPV